MQVEKWTNTPPTPLYKDLYYFSCWSFVCAILYVHTKMAYKCYSVLKRATSFCNLTASPWNVSATVTVFILSVLSTSSIWHHNLSKAFYVTVFSIIVLSAFCYKLYHSDFLLRHTTVRFRCFLVTRVVQRVWVLSQTPFLLQNKREFVSLAGIALAFVNHYTIKPPFYWDTQCIQKMDICFNISQ